jgi:hypothetical protein
MTLELYDAVDIGKPKELGYSKICIWWVPQILMESPYV